MPHQQQNPRCWWKQKQKLSWLELTHTYAMVPSLEPSQEENRSKTCLKENLLENINKMISTLLARVESGKNWHLPTTSPTTFHNAALAEKFSNTCHFLILCLEQNCGDEHKKQMGPYTRGTNFCWTVNTHQFFNITLLLLGGLFWILQSRRFNDHVNKQISHRIHTNKSRLTAWSSAYMQQCYSCQVTDNCYLALISIHKCLVALISWATYMQLRTDEECSSTVDKRLFMPQQHVWNISAFLTLNLCLSISMNRAQLPFMIQKLMTDNICTQADKRKFEVLPGLLVCAGKSK